MMDEPLDMEAKMNRPANYASLTSTARAIIDDHIRAGVAPPKFTPFVQQQPAAPTTAVTSNGDGK